ncbi:MAG: 3-dehydroquinate synthase [Clostridia bacterium]|nr:3-dehydroquinate synthase [Clostridia bacterium]
MKIINVKASKNYTATISAGLLPALGKTVNLLFKPCNVCIVTDDNVASLYLSTVKTSFEQAGFAASSFVFTHGEANKTTTTVSNLLEFLAEKGFDRTDVIVALGGGITGDMAGFAAACYMRGIRYIQVPTTLLAAVDSSVGGKTGVNLSKGKNLAGAFWQPEAVFCDTDTLKTMPKAHYADGLAEAVKCAMIGDPALFDMLRSKSYDIEEVIARCVSLKAEIVGKDEKEGGIRALLNFGHTVAHAVEKSSNYSLSHGSAVSIGMVVITRASEKNGIAEKGLTKTLAATLEALCLPTVLQYEKEKILHGVFSDKKRRGNEITLVVPERIGRCSLKLMKVDDALNFITSGME